MNTLKTLIFRRICRVKLLFGMFLFFTFWTQNALAKDLVDALDLSVFVPLVLKVMMTCATSVYNFFVGNGTGLIYIFIFLFLAFYICLYLFKMFFPKDWLLFLGFKYGGELWTGKTTGWSITENIAKPCLRAVIAIILLLQIKPVYVTDWLVNPFLEFGSIYTEQVLKVSGISTHTETMPSCPITEDWISKDSCNFLVQPVHVISQENNKIIKYGFGFLKTGLRNVLLLQMHKSGENILNIITGLLLISAFVAANVFMALLIIQAIFDFCLSLIMYPFSVLTWVAKKSDKWFDILPPFNQIIESLKKLIITMIACAFILCINIAVTHALFNWSSSAFNVAAGGTGSTNFPTITNTGMTFGSHFMLWLSAILTFFLMQNIFDMTRSRLEMYAGTKPDLYNKVKKDAGILWTKAKATPETVKSIVGTTKKLVGKK